MAMKKPVASPDAIMAVLHRLRDTARDDKLPESVRRLCVTSMDVISDLVAQVSDAKRNTCRTGKKKTPGEQT